MIKDTEIVITAVNSITPVGHNAEMTAASVRSGISRLTESIDYYDIEGNPIISAVIEGISDEEDEVSRIEEIAHSCLEGLLKSYFQDELSQGNKFHLLAGVASLSRPGPRHEGQHKETLNCLAEITQKRTSKKVNIQLITTGNSSVFSCIEIAQKLLTIDPYALCIIGGFDSLLDVDTLDWFEETERLKSETFGRNQSFSPGEAVGFMMLETKKGALRRKKKTIAEIIGLGLATEQAPFLSDKPSKGEGLTTACKTALSDSFCNPADIGIVLGDLNGEFFRSKQWGYAELRCFGNCNESRLLWHPADCLGDIGAASGAVLINIAAIALSQKWFNNYAMVFCSDDEGENGVVILKNN